MARTTDNSEKRLKHIPERTCIACGRKAPVSQLVRAVHTEEGVLLDSARRLRGRGAHVCSGSRCLAKAVERRLFSKAFKCNANTDSLRAASALNDDNCLRQLKDERKMRTR
jgi:uncharacterized protein